MIKHLLDWIDKVVLQFGVCKKSEQIDALNYTKSIFFLDKIRSKDYQILSKGAKNPKLSYTGRVIGKSIGFTEQPLSFIICDIEMVMLFW